MFGTLLFVTALVVFLAFAFVLFADSEDLRDVPGVGHASPVAIGAAIVIGVIIILLVLLLVVRSYDRKADDSDAAEAFFIPAKDESAPVGSYADSASPRRGDLVVYDLWTIAPEANAWGAKSGETASYHFPRNVQSGVYANDYIPIGGGRRLKLRTLLAGPSDLPLLHDAGGPIVSDAPVEELPGDGFMSELEERYSGMKDTGDYDNYETLDAPSTVVVQEVVEESVTTEEDPFEQVAAEVHYDYGGDIHEVIDVEGIGPVFAEKLQQVGVRTTDRLCYEDAEALAAKINTEPTRVRTWQHMAELMKVSGIGPQYAEALARAGVEGIQELKRRSAHAITGQVNGYLESLQSNVLGNKITERRVEGWQEAAKPMRRSRRAIPAE